MTIASAVLSTVSSVPGHVESDPISELARWIPDQLRKRASRFVLAQRVGVAEWETKIVDHLPENLKGSLPTVEEIEAELAPKSAR